MATSERVVMGMDPHKRSVTIEVMTADESVLGCHRFGTNLHGFKAMTEFVKRWPDRVWAMDGCSGIGRHVAMRLVADGQDVVEVPPKLSARARVCSTVTGTQDRRDRRALCGAGRDADGWASSGGR